MKVGILSDTHNDTRALQLILNHFRDEKITTIFHCGDVTSPDTMKFFSDFTIHLAFGNGDYFTGALNETLLLFGTGSTSKRINTLMAEGKSIAIVHGNFSQELHQLITSGRFDLVFTGHTHLQEKTLVGKTRIINPGAANRTGDPPYSYATYDFEKETLDFHRIQL